MTTEADFRCNHLAREWIDDPDVPEKEMERDIESLAKAIEVAINRWLRDNDYEYDPEVLPKIKL